ncbi:MAG: hypothetical protein ABH811_00825 [archaeon]
MLKPLLYWDTLYHKFKNKSLCLDIETDGIKGPITVIGLYTPKEGIIECLQLV